MKRENIPGREMANVKALRQIGRYMGKIRTSKAELDNPGKGGQDEAAEVERSQNGEGFLLSPGKNLKLYAQYN